MAANTAPIYPVTPNLGVANSLLSTAMTNTKAYDGTEAAGTAMVNCLNAGVNGTRVDQILVQHVSTNGATASGTTAATLIRFWVNNGSANTSAGNNTYIGELEIPAATVVALATSKNPVYSFTPGDGLGISIPANSKIYAGLTVAVGGTNCALAIVPIAGDY